MPLCSCLQKGLLHFFKILPTLRGISHALCASKHISLSYENTALATHAHTCVHTDPSILSEAK